MHYFFLFLNSSDHKTSSQSNMSCDDSLWMYPSKWHHTSPSGQNMLVSRIVKGMGPVSARIRSATDMFRMKWLTEVRRRRRFLDRIIMMVRFPRTATNITSEAKLHLTANSHVGHVVRLFLSVKFNSLKQIISSSLYLQHVRLQDIERVSTVSSPWVTSHAGSS